MITQMRVMNVETGLSMRLMKNGIGRTKREEEGGATTSVVRTSLEVDTRTGFLLKVASFRETREVNETLT